MNRGPQKWLFWAMITGIVLGGTMGYLYGPEMMVIDWIGQLFLRALKMIIVPLVVSSMVVGVGTLGDVRKLGRTGAYTVGYYMATTGISVLLGIILVLVIQPGVGVGIAGVAIPERVMGKESIGFSDIILSLFSSNIVRSMADMEILPVIVFSLIFGGILTTIGEKGRKVLAIFDGINEAIMKMVHLIMYLAPIGVFALISARLGAAGGGDAFLGEVTKIGLYATTVLTGLLIHAAVVLPVLLYVFAKRSPLAYAAGMGQAFATAFSTASSAATLPVTLECTIENNKVRPASANFVCPLGATINMDGTALYEAVAVIFIAQASGIVLGPYELVIIFLTATLAAIGAAGIPEAGLVTMVIVLRAVNLPLEGIGLILAIDWFLDRCRTTVNIWGDSIGAAVVDSLANTDSDAESSSTVAVSHS
jgi:solute carrier family 1 (neuronal/epithelial high affinity glutamate transporter), member 1